MPDRRRKLTAEQVKEIRLRYPGENMGQIAKRFSVSKLTIWKILNGRSWKSQPQVTCPHCHRTIL